MDGIISRTGLRPRQLVNITLKPSAEKIGNRIAVSSFDGGIVSGQESLAVSASGTGRFNFQAGQEPGLYRLLVDIGPERYWLHFYVLDLQNPARNPARVRIFE